MRVVVHRRGGLHPVERVPPGERRLLGRDLVVHGYGDERRGRHLLRTGEICSAGSCVCPSVPGTTLTLCPGGCVDLTSDEYSCGACGNVCPSSYLCYESFCFPDGHLGRRLGDGI